MFSYNSTGGEIYRIWFDNDPEQKSYVGQTVQGSLVRIKQHIDDAKSDKGGCPLLDAATRKFGVNHMRYEILEDGIRTHTDLDEAERFWIAHYNSKSPHGYNVKTGGQKSTAKSSDGIAMGYSGYVAKVVTRTVLGRIDWKLATVLRKII